MNINMNKIKCVLAGDSGVGKSSIMYRFINDDFNENSDTTLGASFHNLLLDKYMVDFWDTAGQERYRSLIPMYLRNSNIILLVFDLSYSSSFKSIKSWLKDIRHIDCDLILIGNKLDSKREISRNEVEDLILKYNRDISYLEISAKNGTNVEELREKILILVKSKHKCEETILINEQFEEIIEKKNCCVII